jgi:alcohol dehydrogenase (cytochrome c)
MTYRFATIAARVLAGCCALLAAVTVRPSAQAPLVSPTYTAEQASAGRAVYAQSCASCHGQNLDDGQFASPLKGEAFRQKWGGRGVEALHAYMSAQMPPASPGSLGDAGYVQLAAYLLQQNGVSAGTQPLPSDPAALRTMVFPGAPPGPGGGVTAGVALPRAPARANPLDRITPVSDEMLIRPPDGDWLNWRRTYDAHGFSPLKQITKANVGQLRAAWTWSLAAGPNEGTPLVHDGVIFVHAFGDRVQALDAATGDLLWTYARRLPRGAAVTWKRNMSLYGDRLYVPTSDAHIVALDVKTGTVAWDVSIGDTAKGIGLTGGTLVARGVVMVGTNGNAAGGNYIVGLDAKTGAERWRFYTIARPGEPGDSWNGLPLDTRNGGSVWVAGTYDPALNVALFGPAPTYDTGPLRNLVAGASNDALYTNATIALTPETGKLVWHYQHLKNDQWDFDWAFERTLVQLSIGGVTRTVSVTGGKQMIFDALDATDGRYLWSFDLGLQNVITAIDPKTGAKTIDAALVPGDGTTKMVCPHAGGGRSWLPTSYDATSKLLFVPMVESCMNLTPVAAGERGGLSTGVRFSLRPRPDSDGNYGRLQAMNLETRKPAWTVRQRAPQTTGILATAGGVVFAGAFDRTFSAYDAATGKQLWKTRLNDVPNAAPVTFTAQGRQFVALTVGNGGPQAATFPNLVPEIVSPSNGAALWVFELAK